MDITSTTAPRSDQQNFDDYATGAKVVTVAEVTAGSAEQPVDIHLVEFPGRPFKPSKSMRRVLAACWGAETSAYSGRRMKLYGDPTVKFGGATVGGIRIEALSHIEKAQTISLTTTRGKRAPFTVQPLADDQAARLFALFKEHKLDKAAALELCSQETGRDITATKDLTPAEITAVITALTPGDES
jgi:hypothetical protein